ncbi:MAG: S-layer homology domain-containing protein [Clostridia bacterium]|nr:S-layer homology domain-containing protein [Clostridia bacterium]
MKKFLALTIAIILAYGGLGVSAREAFTDVPESEWMAPYIYNLVDRGVVSGYGDGTFGPMNNVQRCEYAKMLVNIADIELVQSASSPYSDVPADQWFFPYVNSILSLITGYTVNGVLYFKPYEAATREDVTVAMVKALGVDVTQYTDAEGYLASRFTDWKEISSHNYEYIVAAVDKGIITGNVDGTFRPHDPITRAEVSIILCRAFPGENAVPEVEYK